MEKYVNKKTGKVVIKVDDEGTVEIDKEWIDSMKKIKVKKIEEEENEHGTD